MPPAPGSGADCAVPPGKSGLEFLRFLLCKEGTTKGTNTFRIFPGSYPLCKGVIHVEFVENSVERVENSAVFSVETVENPVESRSPRVFGG